MNISVVIPAYNAAKYIGDTLSSVLRQTRAPDEIIVVDDGSSDNTIEMARRSAPAAACIRQENRGVSAARNGGIRQASGDWIALLDADDMWDPRKLEMQCAAIERSPDAGLVYTGHVVLRGGSLGPGCKVPDGDSIAAVLRESCPIMPASVMVRRDIVLAAAGFDESIRTGQEDWDMWVRLAHSGCRFVAVPEPLTIYRDTPGGLSRQVEPFLRGQARFVRDRLNADLPPLRRWIKTRRVISRLESEAAILMREQGQAKYLPMIIRSLRTWPIPLSWPDRRYKTAAHMLLTSLRHPNNER